MKDWKVQPKLRRGKMHSTKETDHGTTDEREHEEDDISFINNENEEDATNESKMKIRKWRRGFQ